MTKKVIDYLSGNFSLILRGTLFVLSVVIIVFLFPKEGKFRYEFQKGTPWLHETFIAPFDFPIYKSGRELKIEKDSILSDSRPYYKCDNSKYFEQMELFKKNFELKWDEYLKTYYRVSNHDSKKEQNKQEKLKALYFQFAVNLMGDIYDAGVIELTGSIAIVDVDDFLFVILKDNLAEEFSIQDVFTQESAGKHIQLQIESIQGNGKYKENTGVAFLKGLELDSYIYQNLFYDDEISQKVKNDIIEDISLTRGMVQKGERIIFKGDVVDGEKHTILESIKKEYEMQLGTSTNYYLIVLGQVILVFVSILVLLLFLLNFRKDILQDTLKTSFILILVLLFVSVASIVIRKNVVSLYLIPFAILPIIIRTFYDTRLALFIHLITVLIVGFLAPNSFEFVFLQLITGIIAIFSLANVRSRGQLFFSAVIIFFAYSFVYFGIAMMQEGSFKSVEWINFIYFAVNSLLLLAAYPLIYIFEKLFGFLSDVTLMELSDTNHPLLRKLAEHAPGTFQHSLQVANLAEEVAYHIDANPMLVRTGALYHDIGKLNLSMYFIENQSTGVNLHDKIEYDKSAEIIIDHVKQGVELAKKYKLPRQIIDFILTHHGNSKAQYFYRSYLNKYPDTEVDEQKFTYPGPSPFSKETAILMMADAIEASSRSLKTITEESINELVEKIINFQVDENQFINTDITFRDLTIAKEVFKKKLANIYHARIEYPK